VSYWIKVYSRAGLGSQRSIARAGRNPRIFRAFQRDPLVSALQDLRAQGSFQTTTPTTKVAARVGARYTRERAAASSRAYTCRGVKARARARSACVYNADDCGGTRPESCLAPVNNAGRGNGAISAHLLLNVRFAALPPFPLPPVPAHPRANEPPRPSPRGSSSALLPPSHPALDPQPATARVAATLTALFLADSGRSRGLADRAIRAIPHCSARRDRCVPFGIRDIPARLHAELVTILGDGMWNHPWRSIRRRACEI